MCEFDFVFFLSEVMLHTIAEEIRRIVLIVYTSLITTPLFLDYKVKVYFCYRITTYPTF